jgi:hypothetical protein
MLPNLNKFLIYNKAFLAFHTFERCGTLLHAKTTVTLQSSLNM